MGFTVLHKFFSFGLIGFLFFSSCGTGTDDFMQNYGGEEFFPLAIGNTWVYQLDSIIYDNQGEDIDTNSWFLREIITEAFNDGEGNKAFRLERSLRKHSTDPWSVSKIWSAYKNDRLAVMNEGNLHFVKLDFPVKINKSWDGNAFIDENTEIIVAGESIKAYQFWDEYVFTEFKEKEKVGNNDFEEVCTIVQVDKEDKITRRFSEEKYARGIGLISKQMIILNTQKFDSNDAWEQKAEEGFFLNQKLLSFTQG